MKIAICLHGLVGNTQSKSGQSNVGSAKVLKLAYRHLKQYFLSKYNCDVFIHSWNVELEEKIVKLFKPKSYIIEQQKIFDIPEWIPGDEKRKQGHYSKWYSNLQSVNLMNKYSERKKIKYDYVLIARFDIAWKKQIKFEELESNTFYIGGWNRKPSVKVKDFWFLGNQKDISRFSNIYNKIEKYCNIGITSKSNGISNHKLAARHILELKLNRKELLECREDFNQNSDYPLIRYEYFGAKE